MPGRCCGGGSLSDRRAAAAAGQPIEMPITPGEMYEVLTASGAPSGRSFNSKPRAQSFADLIGGTIRPKG